MIRSLKGFTANVTLVGSKFTRDSEVLLKRGLKSIWLAAHITCVNSLNLLPFRFLRFFVVLIPCLRFFWWRRWGWRYIGFLPFAPVHMDSLRITGYMWYRLGRWLQPRKCCFTVLTTFTGQLPVWNWKCFLCITLVLFGKKNDNRNVSKVMVQRMIWYIVRLKVW